jgi:hypothetical protein
MHPVKRNDVCAGRINGKLKNKLSRGPLCCSGRNKRTAELPPAAKAAGFFDCPRSAAYGILWAEILSSGRVLFYCFFTSGGPDLPHRPASFISAPDVP